MAIATIIKPELLDFPNDSISSSNASGTIIPAGNNYVSGGGGLVENSLTLSTGVAYTVTIGPGGNKNGSGTNNDSTSGGNSVFHTITSIGGANATFNTSTLIGVSGGSGAGATGHYSASCTPGTAGLGTANQGYAGGSGYGRCNSDEAAGGGGGAGGKGGAAAPNDGGMGGIGIISYIKDPNGTKYAGGGGGGGRTTGGAAVAGYGGSDGVAGTNASDATANTGGGGGSTGGNVGGVRGGNGGSGVVIVRYPSTISAALTTVSGSANQTISGSTDLYAEMISGTGSILFSPNPAGPATTFTADYLVVAGGGGGDMDERGGAGAGGVRTSYGTTRPTTADDGEFRYNEQLGYVEYYDGSNWNQIADEYISGQPSSCICNYPIQASALYEFQDNTNDTCGGANGVPNTITYTSSGKYGKAGVFNGSGYVQIPYNFNFSGSFALSFWINPSTVGNQWQSIIGTDGYGASTHTGFNFYLNYAVLEPWLGGTAGSGDIFQTGSVAVGVWQHIVLSRTYNSKWELFYNGSSLGTNTSLGLTWDLTSRGSSYIGIHPTSFTYEFNGDIDQVRIFTTDLTATQVSELYNEVGCN